MAENMSNALLITLIGMGLVFAAILLLWGLMILMVRLFRDKPESEEKGEETEAIAAVETEEMANDLKLRAAAAAAAVALALQHSGTALFSQPVITTSAWQTALRSASLNQRSQLFSRKS
jgi:Na+-transporting methylmalonyl-CoA/oxaloacetate decarboxylase gamma subunit